MNDAASSPKRRRWLRYSLRTMLLAFTLLALWLGVQTDRAIKQRRAVEVVERLGGSVNYRHQRKGENGYDRKAEHWSPTWLRRFVGDDFFVSAEEIQLGRFRVAVDFRCR